MTKLELHAVRAQRDCCLAQLIVTTAHCASIAHEQLGNCRHARTTDTHEMHGSGMRQSAEIDAHPRLARHAATNVSSLRAMSRAASGRARPNAAAVMTDRRASSAVRSTTL